LAEIFQRKRREREGKRSEAGREGKMKKTGETNANMRKRGKEIKIRKG
jgi:hypothetical protein